MELIKKKTFEALVGIGALIHESTLEEGAYLKGVLIGTGEGGCLFERVCFLEGGR